jgi:hypothetical protein
VSGADQSLALLAPERERERPINEEGEIGVGLLIAREKNEPR